MLAIHGEMILAEEASHETKVTGGTDTENGGKSKWEKLEKPEKEKKQPRERKRRTVTLEENQTGGAFMHNKTLLTMLDVVFLIVYGLCVYLVERGSSIFSRNGVLLCVCMTLPITVGAVVFAQRGKYVFHGVACLLNGIVSVVAVCVALNWFKCPFVGMVAAYGWLGFISLVGMSAKKSIPGLLKKKTGLFSLDISMYILCAALACFWVFWNNYGFFDVADSLLPCALQLAITVLSMILIQKEKYKLRGLLLCAAGVAGVLYSLAHNYRGLRGMPLLAVLRQIDLRRLHMYVLVAIGIAVVYICMAVIPFLKEE